MIYRTIREKKYVHKWPAMTKHVVTVKRLCSVGNDGLAYDRNFRQLKATYSPLPWAIYARVSIYFSKVRIQDQPLAEVGKQKFTHL